MERPIDPSSTPAASDRASLAGELRSATGAEVRDDRLSRALYATDASIYEITPDLVVLPQSVEQVAAAVRFCAEHGIPLTARGAGTGLTGGAVNRGVILDLSRYMNRIGNLDVEARTVEVGPGVVLDELNALLQPHGLHFAPDVATSSRATLGGMIANNSCGARSRVFGRTVDHVQALDVILADGSSCTWQRDGGPQTNELARTCDSLLAGIATDLRDEIQARYPKVSRRNAGYALDRLQLTDSRPNTESLLCGSEGTLAVVVGARLNLLALPGCKGLAIAQFDEMPAALDAVPAILEHDPAAIELVDDHILQAAKTTPAMLRRRWFIEGDPAGILIVEFIANDRAELDGRLEHLVTDLQQRNIGRSHVTILEPPRQADVWAVRKAGLGLLMSRPGDRQPQAFVEDAAIPPDRLREYVARVGDVLRDENLTQAGVYAHASVGVLHVRPALNLKDGREVQAMYRIADRLTSVALEFGGTVSGEHGDGIVRSTWLERMYGPVIIDAFRRIKTAFDPKGILNPGKIVDPLPMTENLRYGGGFTSQNPPTYLDFSEHGGMAGLAEMCSGVGQCRQRLVDTMCPSFMGTNDETHTTRARANALRLALSNRDLIDGLSDPVLDEVFDLCLSCKACKTECPTGTDIARLKAEWLSFKNQREGVPLRSRLVAKSVDLAKWGCTFAPLSNWIAQSPLTRALMERFFCLDKRVPPPKYVRQTFRKWYDRRRKQAAGTPRQDKPPVIYFADTWTNYHTPQVGQAAVKVLEALGYRVVVPLTKCCGRPLISKGLLAEARLLAEQNVQVLGGFAERGLPIVGTEPSCVSVLCDELPQLVRSPYARRIAKLAVNIEDFVAAELKRDPDALKFKPDAPEIVYHGHCHQKALTGTTGALAALTACTDGQASEINSGCCGMAGAFGHEAEHYDVARAIGEQRLFPAIRDRGTAEVAVSGFSCRHQIEHHTDAHPRHVIEILADALA